MNNRAFTFVELMIVISITMLLLLLSFPFYISINRPLVIDRVATRLVQDIRKAMEMTMSAQKFEGSFPEGGYGIYFPYAPSDRYYLFADMDADHVYDPGELVEEIKMEGKVKNRTDLAVSYSKLYFASVTFLPPEPVVFFTNYFDQNLPTWVECVGLSDESDRFPMLSGEAYYRFICVNSVGLLYIR